MATLVVLAATPARASGPLLLEAFAGARDPAVARQVARLARRLRPRPLHGSPLRRAIETTHSRHSTTVGEKQLSQRIARGRRRFIHGAYGEAIRALRGAISHLAQHPALLARQRRQLFVALLFCAHAHVRQHQREQAVALVQQAVLLSPRRRPSPMLFGPELIQLHRRIHDALHRRRRGAVVIRTLPGRRRVFVDGRAVGRAPLRLKLLPGRHQVQVDGGARVHTLVVIGGRSSRMTIDLAADAALQTRPFVALRYADGARLARRGPTDALGIARRLGRRRVLIVGPRRHHGRRVLQATLLSATSGRVLRAASIALDDAARAPDLPALARFIGGGAAGPGLMVRAPRAPHRATARRRRALAPWRWVALALGVGGVGAGVPLLLLHGRGTCGEDRCPEKYDTIAGGLAATVAGGAALLGSALLFYLVGSTPGDGADRTALVVPLLLPRTAVGVSAALTF